MKNDSLAPKSRSKTYGLMELVRRTSPMVGKGPDDTVMSWPNLMLMEVIAVLLTSVILLFWGLALDAPLRELANPDVTENPAKAPWYFLNLQELLLHMHPSFAGVILPTLVLVALMAIPYIDRSQKDVGIWFASAKGKKIALWSTVFTGLVIPSLIVFNEYVRVQRVVTWSWGLVSWLWDRDSSLWDRFSYLWHLQAKFPGSTPMPSSLDIIPAWIVPIGVILGFSYLLYLSIRKWKPNTREVLIALFTGFVISYFLLTISGTLFRGIGMRMTMPWHLPPGSVPY